MKFWENSHALHRCVKLLLVAIAKPCKDLYQPSRKHCRSGCAICGWSFERIKISNSVIKKNHLFSHFYSTWISTVELLFWSPRSDFQEKADWSWLEKSPFQGGIALQWTSSTQILSEKSDISRLSRETSNKQKQAVVIHAHDKKMITWLFPKGSDTRCLSAGKPIDLRA